MKRTIGFALATMALVAAPAALGATMVHGNISHIQYHYSDATQQDFLGELVFYCDGDIEYFGQQPFQSEYTEVFYTCP